MTTIEHAIFYDTQTPLMLSDTCVGQCLEELNETLMCARERGLSVQNITPLERCEIEAMLTHAQELGSREELDAVKDEYIRILLSKGIPQNLLAGVRSITFDA